MALFIVMPAALSPGPWAEVGSGIGDWSRLMGATEEDIFLLEGTGSPTATVLAGALVMMGCVTGDVRLATTIEAVETFVTAGPLDEVMAIGA